METADQAIETQALAALRRAYGESLEFRDGQWEAIQNALDPGAKWLVVERTGWGKSVVYFCATVVNRSRGRGPTVVVSPLLALMRNQIHVAERFGLTARSIDSTNPDEWRDVGLELAADTLDVLFISPERLGQPFFRDNVLPIIEERASLAVIDEAHCISEWGHDFRPDYRRIVELVRSLNPECSVLATTATATKRVEEDVSAQLGKDVRVRRGALIRESLQLSVFKLEDHAERLAWLVKYLPRFPGTGIVYTLTIHDAETVAAYLKERGIEAEAYHSDLEHEIRLDLETKFEKNELKALVATTALGMGYDKADVGYVVHFQAPTSTVAYYQQIGRAGRMLENAFAALLWGDCDAETTEHFIETAIPPKALFDRVLGRLSEGPATFGDLAGLGAFGQVSQALGLMEVEGVVLRDALGYRLAPDAAQFPYEAFSARRDRKRGEYRELLAYASTSDCRMATLARTLGDESVSKCMRCDNCKPHATIALDPSEIARAAEFVRSTVYPIEPRKRLIAFEGLNRALTLEEDERLEPGIALSGYNDSGYGRLVRDGKYRLDAYPEELLQPAADAIRTAGIQVEWLTWAPSLDHGKVQDFAMKLSELLGIEAVEAVRKVKENSPQKAMRSSKSQLANVWDAFEIVDVRPGNCLLVDDIVDSGWTLAVIGAKLRAAGSGPVTPFALATARPLRRR